MIECHNISSYLRWQFRAHDRHGHGVHSPFLFSLIDNGLFSPIEAEWVSAVERRRKQLLADRREVVVTDYGSGSSFGNGSRRVCDIARHSSTSPRDGRLLCNLATAIRSRNILELGTNLGIGSLYLAHSSSCERLITIEGCPNLSKIASDSFKQLETGNITIVNSEFSEALPKALQSLPSLDFVFLDGNHRCGPTLSYFNQCLPFVTNDTVFVIDDIHKNADMEQAWTEIVENEQVTLSLDFYTMGVVFFRRQLSKQNICLRY